MKTKRNNYQKIIEILCFIMLLGTSIYLVLNWKYMPDKIPAHYNALGEVDRMGNKSELLILPFINWLLYFGITAMEHFPQMWNTGVTITVENKEQVYAILRNMIATTKLLMIGIFTYITLCSSQLITMDSHFLPVAVVLTFTPIVYYLIKLRKV